MRVAVGRNEAFDLDVIAADLPHDVGKHAETGNNVKLFRGGGGWCARQDCEGQCCPKRLEEFHVRLPVAD